MKKKLISLTDRQVRYLDFESKKNEISFSELIRRILDMYIEKGIERYEK
jgi:hypothetical protein